MLLRIFSSVHIFVGVPCVGTVTWNAEMRWNRLKSSVSFFPQCCTPQMSSTPCTLCVSIAFIFQCWLIEWCWKMFHFGVLYRFVNHTSNTHTQTAYCSQAFFNFLPQQFHNDTQIKRMNSHYRDRWFKIPRLNVGAFANICLSQNVSANV